MNSEVEYNIRNNVPWNRLPSSVKKSLGNSQKEYEKEIVSFSISNQLRFRGNLVSLVRKDEQRYYEELLTYSRTSLLLYPYHLSDIIVKGLRVTPFQYYTRVLETIMESERSYDSLPNFTAADCLRLLGIGRNEYIDIMNQCRSGRKLFRRKNVKDLLPVKPIDIHIEPWWIVETGYIVEEDMKLVSQAEKDLIDRIIDFGKERAGDLDYNVVHSLYKKGLIYLEVPIENTDYIVVPPLEGFVMNRVLGDYFETLLYKIFVSIDEHTSVEELSSVLQINLEAVKQAVSLYCRLGFARKKVPETEHWHSSWNSAQSKIVLSPTSEIIPSFSKVYSELGSPLDEDLDNNSTKKNRIAFLFDSTLTAFLMMGNLSPGLKSHAVTMFEVGKLTDESMDSFLSELEKVSTARDDSEGEARRYFEHALVLRSTILRLRHLGLDLVRCESLQSLDSQTCSRLLNKNYSLVVSMAPLSGEVSPILSSSPPYLGPPSPQAHSLWFKLFLYQITKSGPPSILITRGTRLRKLPKLLRDCEKALITSWGHDPTVIATSSLLFTLNEALCYSPVLAQAYGSNKGAETFLLPFPFPESPVGDEDGGGRSWRGHPCVVRLEKELGLSESCGYLTLVNIPPDHSTTSTAGHLGSQAPSSGQQQQARQKELMRLPLRSATELHCLETPATPSSLDAWIKTMSGEGDSRVKAYPGSPLKEELEPANGLTSHESANLLQQEIDSLADSNQSSPLSHGSESEKEKTEDCRPAGAVVDCGGCLPPRLHVSLITSPPSPAHLTDWCLLDCSYGIPLFDPELNEIICSSLVDRLSRHQSLDKLTSYNTSVSKRLSEFIETVQVSTARDDSEGEARRYFEHALVLRSTILRLRHLGLDLVRCESLQSLDSQTCSRLLNKNYSLVVSMAPLSGEVSPILSSSPPYLGPPSPQAHSLWFKLFLYQITKSGPPSILITRGTRLRKLPKLLRDCEKALITSWGHDPTVIATSSLLFTLNEALCYSPVLAQAYGSNKGAETFLLPFPFPESPVGDEDGGGRSWRGHPCVVRLEKELGLSESCGYLTLVNIPPDHSTTSTAGHLGSQAPSSGQQQQARQKELMRLPLRSATELHCLETPATPSSLDAWIKTMSGEGDSRVKAYPGSPLKEELEPANGLTSHESANLLQQEIDSLADSNQSSPLSHGSESEKEKTEDCRPAGAVVDCGGCLPPRLHVSLTTSPPSPAHLTDWCLLDCSYGIPLFDPELNEIICSSLVDRLSRHQSLDKLTSYNTSVSKRLSEFIETVQGWSEESSGIDSPLSSSQDIPWPLLSVTFLNGQLTPWDGK